MTYFPKLSVSRQAERACGVISVTSVSAKSRKHPHRSCTLPIDIFHLPTIGKAFPLPFAYCRPLRAAQQTLEASGSMLGLAPSKHLRQIDTPFFLHQLLDEGIVQRPVVSLMLISGREGVLSLGGTGAQAADMADKQTASELDRAGAQEKLDAFTQENGKTLEGGTNSLDKDKARIFEEKISLHKRGTDFNGPGIGNPDWTPEWTWTKVQGAEGWWQTLMQGVWVGGSRVLRNQAVVLDVRMRSRIENQSMLTKLVDQYPLHPGPAARSKIILRLGGRLPAAGSTVFELLCLPMHESSID